MVIRSPILLLLFFSSFLSVFSLYEDQVCLVDWLNEFELQASAGIGKVKHAVFQAPKAGRKRVVVSTESNVVASLDLRRGETFWRHVLGENDSIDQIDIASGKYVIMLSSGGSILRAWNLPDGQMVWETSLAVKEPSKSLLLIAPDQKFDRGNVILIYGNGCLHAVSSVDGTILWNVELMTDRVNVQQLVQPVGGDVVYAVGFSDSSHLHVYEVSLKNGELLKYEVEEFSGGFSGEISMVSSNTLVALDANTSNLVVVYLRDRNISFQKKYIPDIVPGFSGVLVILPSKLSGIFAMKVDSYAVFIRVEGNGLMEMVDVRTQSSLFEKAKEAAHHC